MQRIGIVALCQFVAVATAWFLIRSGAQGQSGSVASREAALREAAPTQGSERDTETAGGSRGFAGDGASLGSGPSEVAPWDAPSNGLEAEHAAGSNARQNAEALGQQARAWAESNPQNTPTDPGSAEPSGGVLGGEGPRDLGAPGPVAGANLDVPSESEIQARIREKFKDGSMSPEQPAEARRQEAERIREKTKIAEGLAN